MLEDLEGGLLEYETVEEFLADIRKEFGGGDEESVKVVKLRLLVEEFKRRINTMIYWRLMELE